MEASEAIRAVLLGEADPSELTACGYSVTFTGSGSSISEPAGVGAVFASIGDVASGYVAAWAAGAESLRRWAQAVLGIPALDLTALEDNEDGKALLAGVWDASAGRADAFDLATRLAQGR